MEASFQSDGFEIHQGLLAADLVSQFRKEADWVAKTAQSVCVRHLRSRSQLFDELATSSLIGRLLPEGMQPVRSILFDKTADNNWPVPWHQDLTIAVANQVAVEGYGPWSLKDGSPHVQPPTALLSRMLTVRLHLDETSFSNGALQVIPRSHHLGKLSSEQVREESKADSITCECQSGDALIMSPLILHSSQRSQFPQRRRVLHFEFAYLEDLDSKLNWFEAV